MFNLTDYFNIGFLRSSNNILTREELEHIYNTYVPKGVEVEIYEGGSGASYDYKLKRIEISKRDLYEEVFLHEIGHAVMSEIKGTSNYKLRRLKEGQKFPKEWILDSEQEAWDWAAKHASKPWGFRTKLHIKVSLRSYKVNLPKELTYKRPEND